MGDWLKQMMHRRADDPERRGWQDPEAILAAIGLKPGDTFMDIGCGGGFFTLPAARMVGEGGRVYGVDANAEYVNELKQLARREGLGNLYLTAGRAEDSVLCQSCAHFVFFGIVLHDFDDPARVLQNARQMLKPTGQLVNLDWKKVATPVGPPLHKRFSEETAAQLIEAVGFTIVNTRDTGLYHYIITAIQTIGRCSN